MKIEPVRTGPDAEKIRAMFSEIAGNYDRANTVLSGGVHHLWRKSLVAWSGARFGQRVLDCASGTGDLAIEFKRAVGLLGEVIGTDFCTEMLAYAPAKVRNLGLDIKFEQADVTQLPYETGGFHVASISFGIRNVQDPLKGLSELARVVKPGGAVMVLELGQPSIPGFREAYNVYSRHVLPMIGGWITGRKQAYDYLQDSSSHFPYGEAFKTMMMKTGRFASCEAKPLTFGIAYMYKGIVREIST